MSKLLYCDLTNGKLRRSLGGAEFSFGTIPHIGIISLGLRFSKQIGSRHIEVYPQVDEIRATIGPLDERPETGQFSLKVGVDAPVLGTNLTTLLDYDCTASQLAAALNTLTIVGTAVVVEDDATFLVTGIPEAITVYENTLRPISFVRVMAYEVSGTLTQAIRLQRAPFAFTDSYDERVPNAPTVERIAAGGVVDEVEYPEIQKLTIPLEFNGSYRLRRSDPTRKSALLGVADGPEEIAAAINPTDTSVVLADDLDGIFLCEEHPTDPAVILTFGGSMIGIAHDLIEVEVFDPPPADHWIHLNPQTAMTEEALRDTNLIRRVPIEIHADLQLEDDDQTRSYCLYRGECSIQECVTHDDLATAHEIDWTNPPAAKRYLPVSPDSLTEGTRFYEFLLGDGSETEFQVPHNLASPRVRVSLRENEAGGRELVHGADFEWVHDDDDALTITLLGDYASTPPAAEAIAGTVQDLTLTSTWLDPVDVPIANVAGLQTILDSLAAAIAELQAGNFGGAAPATTAPTGTIGRYLRSVWEIPRARPASKPVKPDSLRGWDPFGDGSLLRDIRLLPAVHVADGDLETLPLPLPAAAATYRDRVFYVPTDTGIFLTGQFAACDGREWYRVEREDEDEITWYPSAFNIELFRFSVTPDELALRTVLETAFGIELVLVDPSRRPADRRVAARMSLILERGVRVAESTPSGIASNIESYFGSPVVLAQHDFDLTAEAVQKRMALTIARDGAGALTAKASKFLQALAPVSAPSTADFAIRARLGRFDVTNLPTDGRGILAIRGLDVGLDGLPDTTLGRWSIS